MIPMMPTIPDSGGISGKPEDTSPASAATPKSAYTTSVVEISDAEGAAGGAGVSVIFSPLLAFIFLASRPRRRSRPRTSIGIAPAVLVRRVFAVAGIAPQQIVVGVERVVAVDAIANLEIYRGYRAAVDEMVRVALGRRIAGTHARAQRLLARLADKHDL